MAKYQRLISQRTRKSSSQRLGLVNHPHRIALRSRNESGFDVLREVTVLRKQLSFRNETEYPYIRRFRGRHRRSAGGNVNNRRRYLRW